MSSRRCTLAILAALSVSCGPSPPKNLLLVTLDTLRADRLGAYGYREAVTPNLDRLAAEGVRFETAIAQVPLTLPSHTSLFTGTYPMHHGVRDNGVPFSGGRRTLAELARESGYETAAFVSAFVLDSKWGLDRGFDTYFDEFELTRYKRISLASVERRASETVDALLSWLSEPRERPFIAWLHLFDPHAPYDPPEPFRSRFAERPYDGEIAYLDAELGRVLEALDDETLVVVVGDHGEGLGEHGELTHGNFVYDETLRVPWLMRFPDGRARGVVVEEVVALVDVLPTVAASLELPLSAEIDGESVLPLLEREPSVVRRFSRRALLAESLYPRLHYGWSEVVALRSPEKKFIDTPRAELYDLAADRGETRNRVEDEAELAERMKRELRDRFVSAPRSTGTETIPLDAETERRLRALGYVGGSAPATPSHRSELPDPKDKIDLVQAISRADALGARGEIEEAIAILEDVVAEDPNIIDAWVSLGNKFSSAGRYEEAIESFRRSLELSPDYDLALVNLALSYQMAGRLDDARIGFERVLARDPENRQALFNLGEIAMKEKDHARALDHLRGGLELEPGSAVFARQAGMAYYYQGELESSLARLQEAARNDPALERVHYAIALVHEKRGEAELAEKSYLKELEHHPDHLMAGFNLAELYGSQGRTMEQIGILERLTKAHPEWGTGFIQLAKAYRDSGLEELHSKALDAAEIGIRLEPDSELTPLAYYLRAEILDKMGRKDEARRAFEKGKALAERKPGPN